MQYGNEAFLEWWAGRHEGTFAQIALAAWDEASKRATQQVETLERELKAERAHRKPQNARRRRDDKTEEIRHLRVERESLYATQAHKGSPCIFCGMSMEDVAVGLCPANREYLAAEIERLKADKIEMWNSAIEACATRIKSVGCDCDPTMYDGSNCCDETGQITHHRDGCPIALATTLKKKQIERIERIDQ